VLGSSVGTTLVIGITGVALFLYLLIQICPKLQAIFLALLPDASRVLACRKGTISF
jgi:hypothetical protein